MAAAVFSTAIPNYWYIKKRLFWPLDINSGENAATNHKEHIAGNLSHLEKIGLNVLRLEAVNAAFSKLGLAKKPRLAARDDKLRAAMLRIKPIHHN